jgi:predicted Rossmann fold nucleotide-binding protein DprA/Smf involved in DNA uptake
MIDTHPLSPDTQTTLLLCATLGQRISDVSLLSPTEYHALAQWLFAQKLRPADLLTQAGIEQLHQFGTNLINIERVTTLLARGAALALAVEQWNSQGLWVLSRSDSVYPQRLRNRLGRTMPPILYGVGKKELLEQGGLAIVGSREIDENTLAFTQLAARHAAAHGIAVVSGGARGVDRTAMEAALGQDGAVIGVLADSLAKEAVTSKYRQPLRKGTLVLCSPYDPGVGFNVGNAMGRNRIIYALSDYGLVVSATLEKGGTWAGAIENLRQKWVPLLIWASSSTPHGNQALIEKGGVALTETDLHHGYAFGDLAKPLSPPSPEVVQLTLDPYSNEASVKQATVQEAQERYLSTATEQTSYNLFERVWPTMREVLTTPRTEKELAELLVLQTSQVRAWLEKAEALGRVTKISRPTRYTLTAFEGAKAISH